jgi:hypothetical protein
MARKEKQYHYIYKTTNMLNGKYYYGMHSTDNLNNDYFGSGRRLKRSLNKYGKENHKVDIIEFLSNRKSLVDREKEIVNLNEVAKENCMNLRIGGTGGLEGLSDESIQKIRKGASDFLKRKWKDPEYCKKINNLSSVRMKNHHENHKIRYNNFTNKKHTEETKIKIGKKNKLNSLGIKNSQYGTCWITKDNVNKKIKKTELFDYIKKEWIPGRLI